MIEIKPVAQLVIVLRSDGAVSVDGCIHDRILSYGLLEMAREAIFQMYLEAQKRIQPASASDLALVAPRNGS